MTDALSAPNPSSDAASKRLTAQLKDAAEYIEAALQALLSQRPHGEHNAQTVPDRLNDAMRHAVLGGGKRFRPFLVLETAALFGVTRAQATPAALGIELIHCYSLAHDDLPAMDNDTLRRGQPTVWRAFDDWTAILAGDALQALAFEVLSGPSCHDDAAVRSELCGLLARASGACGMVGGQALDLAAERLVDGGTLDVAAIRQLQSMKTGALIVFSCEVGAVLGRGTAQERDALLSYGDHLGYAFQIADDLLDVEGDVETVGKAVAKDQDAGKATLVSLMGVEAARAELERTRLAAIAALDVFGSGADTLRAAADFVVKRRS